MSNKYPIVLKSVALTPASGSAESDGQAGWSSACTGNAGPSRALRDFDVPELQVRLRLHISESWPMFAPSPGRPAAALARSQLDVGTTGMELRFMNIGRTLMPSKPTF